MYCFNVVINIQSSMKCNQISMGQPNCTYQCRFQELGRFTYDHDGLQVGLKTVGDKIAINLSIRIVFLKRPTGSCSNLLLESPLNTSDKLGQQRGNAHPPTCIFFTKPLFKKPVITFSKNQIQSFLNSLYGRSLPWGAPDNKTPTTHSSEQLSQWR